MFKRIFCILFWYLSIPFYCYTQSIPSISKVDSLKTSLENAAFLDQEYANILLVIADEYVFTNKDSSKFYAEKANQISQQNNYVEGQCKSYNLLGRLAESETNYESGLKYHKLSGELATKAENFSLMGLSKLNIGRVLSLTNQFDSAKVTLLDGLSDFEKAEDVLGIAKSCNNLGLVTGKLGQMEASLDYYIRSSEAFTNPKSGATPGEYFVVFSNIGSTYWGMGDFEKAVAEIKKAIDILRELNNLDALIHDFALIGRVYTDMGAYEEAQKYFNEGLEIMDQVSNKDVISIFLLNLGVLHNKNSKYDQAKLVLNRSLDYFSEKDRPDIASEVYRLLGNAYSATQNQQQAVQCFEKSLNFIEQTSGNAYGKLAILKSLHKFYKETGKYKKALSTYESYTTLQDSFFRNEKQKNISELQTKYETVEKEREIAVLTSDKQKQELALLEQKQFIQFTVGALALILLGLGFLFYRYQNKKKVNNLLTEKNEALSSSKKSLENALLEKETLLKEIHHRVKNNLQLITSLLNLQAEDSDAQSIEDFLYKGQNRVKSMALIHEQLYRSDNIAVINIQDYIQQLVSGIFQSFGIQPEEIKLYLKLDQVKLDIDQAIPLGLIINELVNNSLKHAFADKEDDNLLMIELKEKQSGVELVIRDNGSGFESYESTQNSIGLSLVKLLARQLKGSINFNLDRGTEVRLRFENVVEHNEMVEALAAV